MISLNYKILLVVLCLIPIVIALDIGDYTNEVEGVVIGGLKDSCVCTGNFSINYTELNRNYYSKTEIDAFNAGFAPKTLLDLFLGDFSDGTTSITSATTLSREMHYKNLTITGNLTTGGYIIRAYYINISGGTIKFNGNNGGNASGINAGTGGGVLTTTQLGGGQAGQTGKAGSLNDGTSQTTHTNCGNYMGGNGANCYTGGCTGGASIPDGIGGMGGALGTNNYMDVSTLSNYQAIGGTLILGGCGGTNGGEGGGDWISNKGGGSGGGGGGAGVIQIYAKYIHFDNGGKIEAIGGKGGNGGNGQAGNTGGGAGASGGGGGRVMIFTQEITGTPVINISGGNKGTGGANGGSGSNGNNGLTGGNGAYTIYYLNNGSIYYATS